MTSQDQTAQALQRMLHCAGSNRWSQRVLGM